MVLSIAAVSFASDLTDAKSSGEIIFGVAPDYIPFAFHDKTGEITGIDVELMKEIGRRMGLKVKVADYAFDGMIDALNIEQVDVIGTAFAITEARQNVIDFTRPYYNSNVMFLASSSALFNRAASINDFSGKVVGVQKGTSFEQWVQKNLVEGNYIPAKNVYTYTTVPNEMDALASGKVDIVIVDEDSYTDVYSKSGKYKVFAEGFMKEDYAFGLRKGSDLTPEINRHLNDMIADGTAQEIANRLHRLF